MLPRRDLFIAPARQRAEWRPNGHLKVKRGAAGDIFVVQYDGDGSGDDVSVLMLTAGQTYQLIAALHEVVDLQNPGPCETWPIPQ